MESLQDVIGYGRFSTRVLEKYEREKKPVLQRIHIRCGSCEQTQADPHIVTEEKYFVCLDCSQRTVAIAPTYYRYRAE